MTESDYCIVSNLARLRGISDTLRHIYECEHITQEEVATISVAVSDAIQKHEAVVETAMD